MVAGVRAAEAGAAVMVAAAAVVVTAATIAAVVEPAAAVAAAESAEAAAVGATAGPEAQRNADGGESREPFHRDLLSDLECALSILRLGFGLISTWKPASP